MEDKIMATPGTYRTGAALDEKPLRSIKISGTLPAPFDFIEGKEINDLDAHLLIFKDQGKLELHLEDTNPYTEHVITGSLKRDSVLEQFALNTEKRWSTQEFLAFIKTMRYYFPDKAQHKSLVDSLMKWSAQINTVLKEAQDTKGNSSFEIERKVSGVPLITTFSIEVPIFQGYPKQKFSVEIGLDPQALRVDIYLISDDLIELEIGQRENLINDEVAKFHEYTFSKVIIS